MNEQRFMAIIISQILNNYLANAFKNILMIKTKDSYLLQNHPNLTDDLGRETQRNTTLSRHNIFQTEISTLYFNKAAPYFSYI